MCIEKKMEQFNSGESMRIFRKISRIALIDLTTGGRKAWQEEEETRIDISTALILQEQILYLGALQGHSGRSLIDPTLEDNVVCPSNFFQYIYHVGCAINFHSFINRHLEIKNLSNWQTTFFLLVDPMDKNHKDLDTIDLNVPRHAQHMHKVWKTHQNTVYWIDINLALKEGLKFYQIRSNAIILHETLPDYCIPKVVRMKSGEVIYMTGRENWVQITFNDQKDKLCNN